MYLCFIVLIKYTVIMTAIYIYHYIYNKNKYINETAK